MHLRLYAASFVSNDTQRVVILYARDEDEALYCLSEGWRNIQNVSVTRIDNLEIGLMHEVYSSKASK